MTVLRLALLQQRISLVEGVAGFTERIDRAVAEAGRAGADLAVLPEYAAVESAGQRAGGPDLREELIATTDRASELIEAMRSIARRREIWLQPGSLPVPRNGAVQNLAPLIAPTGEIGFQAKRVLTRFEREAWDIQPGDEPSVFRTPWGLIGIAICYDVEFPLLVRAQVEAGAWLVLVPTCTDTMHGFNRVRLAARARAMENQCYIAVSPTVGAAPWLASLDENRGYAAVFSPVDRGFPEDGVIARGALDAEQWLFAELDPARLDEVRRAGAVFNHADWPPAPGRCSVVALT
jgi:predicted amidohydrolase